MDESGGGRAGDRGHGEQTRDDRVPGDRPPTAAAQRTRPLDRAPGERYGTVAADTTGAGQGPGAAQAIAAVALTTVAGAALYAVLGSFDLGVGMLVVAAFMGWAVSLAVVWARVPGPGRRPWLRAAGAAVLAAGSVVGGLVALWAWALTEGGVLGPIAYADARFGILALVQVVVAAVVAAIRAR